MARVKRIIKSIFILLMMISFPSPLSSKPVPAAHKSDLISGNEFLSLFLNSYDVKKETKRKRVYENANAMDSFKYYEGSNAGSEDQASSNFGLRKVAKKFGARNATSSTAKPSAPDSTQIVQLVTSGSKIVFLDDKPAEVKKPRNATKADDIQVIAVSVSSSVDTKAPKKSSYFLQNDKINDVSSNPDSSADEFAQFDDQEEKAKAEDDSKSDFINHSRKSEFSIEEVEPLMGRLLDSVSGESRNVHSVVAPPASHNQVTNPNTINQSTAQNASSQLTNAGISAANDKLMPFQTVIYHDSGRYSKDGNARPRSVSYSSIAQNIEQINSWKDSERLLEAKKNVSDSLRQPLAIPSFSKPEQVYSEPAKFYSEPAKVYGQPSKFYSEPAKVYSEPAKVYGQPEKQYGEPAKVYSEPSKIYSEPAKVYSEPAKVYGEPSKVYWPRPTTTTTTTTTQRTPFSSKMRPTTKNPHSNSRRVLFNLDKLPYDLLNAPEEKPIFEPELAKHYRHRQHYTNSPDSSLVTERPKSQLGAADYTPMPEQNYEVEESVSVMTNGRAHGIQPTTMSTTPTANAKSAGEDDSKVGYVVEGRNFRKYRVEEKTSDGFIVGEYGVVSHNDGSLRGVRYTADSNINPNLIHEALMKFLSL